MTNSINRLELLQAAQLNANGASRRGLRLASVLASDGSALFVAADKARTNIWVEGAASDGIHRAFHLMSQRFGGRLGSFNYPFMSTMLTYYEKLRRSVRLSVTISPEDKAVGVGIASF